MDRGWGGRTGLAAAVAVALLTTGCARSAPAPLPTVGSPSPSASPTEVDQGRAEQLAKEWDLVGAPLPADWPGIPLPRGTEVITAYAIGVEPQRTWTATFAADRGTALDLAEPVVAELRDRGYQPIAEYVGAATTNTGLYSFAAPSFAVYLVLGEDDGRPNLVITVRGTSGPGATSSAATASAPAPREETPSAGPTQAASDSPSAAGGASASP